MFTWTEENTSDGTVAFKYFIYFNVFRYASEGYKYPSVILFVCKIWRLVCARAHDLDNNTFSVFRFLLIHLSLQFFKSRMLRVM